MITALEPVPGFVRLGAFVVGNTVDVLQRRLRGIKEIIRERNKTLTMDDYYFSLIEDILSGKKDYDLEIKEKREG